MHLGIYRALLTQAAAIEIPDDTRLHPLDLITFSIAQMRSPLFRVYSVGDTAVAAVIHVSF